MGKNLIQQRRGKGTLRYRALFGKLKVNYINNDDVIKGKVVNFVKCPYHSAPVIEIKLEDHLDNLPSITYNLAPEGIRLGDEVFYGGNDLKLGNVLQLKDIPEGTSIYNIELIPGDGGRLIRTAGNQGKIVSKQKGKVIVLMPSKKEKVFDEKCRATIGVIAGGGKSEKPLLKAGNAHYKYKSKHKLWPKVSGVSMNAVDHPFGGTSSAHKGKPTIAPKNAPAGRKVGKIRPKRTGKR